MIEVPEELIERAAEAMKGTSIHGYHGEALKLARLALAAVLPDLIAAIEAEYEQVGWQCLQCGTLRTSAHHSPLRCLSAKSVPVVRRVP